MGFLNMQPIANNFLPKIFLHHYNHSLLVYITSNISRGTVKEAHQ